MKYILAWNLCCEDVDLPPLKNTSRTQAYNLAPSPHFLSSSFNGLMLKVKGQIPFAVK